MLNTRENGQDHKQLQILLPIMSTKSAWNTLHTFGHEQKGYAGKTTMSHRHKKPYFRADGHFKHIPPMLHNVGNVSSQKDPYLSLKMIKH